jgi:hypothetical protein
MDANSPDQTMLDTVLKLLTRREHTYETGVQTTVCGKMASGWQNLLTKVEFVCKGESLPEVLAYEYPEVVIVRRVLTGIETASFLKGLVMEHSLQTGQDMGSLALQGRFSMGRNTRRPHCEWSRWPGDVFLFEPSNAQNFPGNAPLMTVDAPYYPSFDQVLSEYFEIRFQSWTNYFRGQAAVVLPDFRARISKLTIALACLRADLEYRFIQTTDLVAKVYAENSVGRLIQQTVCPESANLQVELADTPTFASVALMCRSTGEVLDERTYRANATWPEPGVFVEMPEQEIEQLLLTGENDTVEFKERVEKGRPEKIAKTVAAFANTKGGTIVFGVDDDHRVVGCAVKGMADSITNIIRSYCTPSPEYTITVVNHGGKDLVLVRIAESPASVHTVRDLGPFIRASGTNRALTSYELEALFRRRQSVLGAFHGLS